MRRVGRDSIIWKTRCKSKHGITRAEQDEGIMKSTGLKIKIEADMSEVIELRNILRECREDAQQLGFSKRQLRKLIKTISCENSSYRKYVKEKCQNDH